MRIQIIDDDRAIASTLKEFLDSIGHECRVYTNPVLALSEHEAGHFQVVLTDLRMPHLDGLSLMDRLSAIDSSAFLIAMTGQTDVGSAVACKDRGVYAYFTKPIDLRRLVNVLGQAERDLTVRSIR
ncbi:response regulator [bacterium]|nr:response regulator [bacterium]